MTPAIAITIAAETPLTAEIAGLVADAEAHSAALYPAESNHHLPIETLAEANVTFLVARDATARAIAIGAVVMHGDWAEVKSMWVAPAARGAGLSHRLLERLIARAQAAGAAMVRLETGIANHAALGLYRHRGFRDCSPFADYRPDPLSVFMELKLAGCGEAQG